MVVDSVGVAEVGISLSYGSGYPLWWVSARKMYLQCVSNGVMFSCTKPSTICTLKISVKWTLFSTPFLVTLYELLTIHVLKHHALIKVLSVNKILLKSTLFFKNVGITCLFLCLKMFTNSQQYSGFLNELFHMPDVRHGMVLSVCPSSSWPVYMLGKTKYPYDVHMNPAFWR